MRIGSERNSGRGGCALCGGPKRHKGAVTVVAVCDTCSKDVCSKHARWSEGKTICTSCLRDKPPDVQRKAIPVG